MTNWQPYARQTDRHTLGHLELLSEPKIQIIGLHSLPSKDIQIKCWFVMSKSFKLLPATGFNMKDLLRLALEESCSSWNLTASIISILVPNNDWLPECPSLQRGPGQKHLMVSPKVQSQDLIVLWQILALFCSMQSWPFPTNSWTEKLNGFASSANPAKIWLCYAKYLPFLVLCSLAVFLHQMRNYQMGNSFGLNNVKEVII